jgi:hypothetical protein
MPTPTQRRTGASAAKADDLAGLIRESEETTTGQSPALPVAPNWKFFLRHWPSEWSVGMVKVDGKDKPFWLPVISKHEVRPGVNLNRTLKRGEEPRAAYDHQVLADTRQGATYLDLNDWRTRYPNGRRYRAEAPCRDPRTKREGVFFLEACKTPRDKLPNKPLKFDTDRDLYNEWKLRLVQLGAIQSPPASLLRAKIREKENEIDRVRSFTGIDDSEKKRRVSAAEKVWKLWKSAEVPEFDPELVATVKASS